MPIPPPSRSELRAFAEPLGLHLDGDELDGQMQLITAFLGSFAALEAFEEPARPPAPERAHRVPTPEENPLGAWVHRTSVRERSEGPLAGRTVAVKDNVALAGVPLGGGTGFLGGYVPEQDATIVRRILEAGGEITGTTACEYLSLSAGSHTSATGPVRNPHDPSRTTGGSSCGSGAAVAAGEVDMAIGGDQGGSIRFPAAYCGIVGMKPTHGLVPYTGILSIDAHIDHTGPMTRDVADNALLLEVLAGPDGIDPRQQHVRTDRYAAAAARGADGMRVALLAEGFGAPVEPAVASVVRDAAERLAGLGVAVEEVSVPEHARVGLVAVPLLILGNFDLLRGGGFAKHGCQPVGFGLPEAFDRWREHADAMPANVKGMVLAGALAHENGGHHHYAKALRLRTAARATYDAALRGYDALLMPTTTCVAPPIPPPDASPLELFAAAGAGVGNTIQFDVTGHPALSIPCGDSEGLPVGAMLVGRHSDEGALYRLAGAFERG